MSSVSTQSDRVNSNLVKHGPRPSIQHHKLLAILNDTISNMFSISTEKDRIFTDDIEPRPRLAINHQNLFPISDCDDGKATAILTRRNTE